MPERNASNRRCYSDKDLTWIEFIKRLKDTGMPIKEIKHYAQLRADGNPTLSERMEMLVQHRKTLNEQITLLQEHKTKIAKFQQYLQSFSFTISKLFHPDSSSEKLFTMSVIVSELQYIFKFFFARVIAV